MKIGYYNNRLDRGGTEVLTLDIARNLGDDKDFTFITTRKGNLDQEIAASGRRLVHIDRKKSIDPGFLFRLHAFFHRERFDVVHVNDMRSALWVYLALLGCKRPKLICSVHGYHNRNRTLYKLNYCLYDCIISVSRALLEFNTRICPRQRFQKKLRLLYNGIDSVRIRNGQNRGVLRAQLAIDEHAPLIGMVGNILEGRDHLTVCRAAAGIVRALPDAHIVLIGAIRDPDIHRSCLDILRQDHVEDRVHFVGSRDDVPDCLREFDLYLYSSNHDTFGISVIEAMMAGLPVVVNDLPVFDETTNHGKYAAYYRTKDPADLAEKVINLLQAPIRCKELGAAGQAWAMEKFDISAHIKNLLQIYDEV